MLHMSIEYTFDFDVLFSILQLERTHAPCIQRG